MRFHVIRNGQYIIVDRLKRGDTQVLKGPSSNHQWDGSTWNKVVQPKLETDLDVIQQAAQFILDNLTVPVEKQAKRDQLKTKLNTKRGVN